MEYTAQELEKIKAETHGYLNMTNLLIGNPSNPKTQNLLIQENKVIQKIHKAATVQPMNLSSLETTTGKTPLKRQQLAIAMLDPNNSNRKFLDKCIEVADYIAKAKQQGYDNTGPFNGFMKAIGFRNALGIPKSMGHRQTASLVNDLLEIDVDTNILERMGSRFKAATIDKNQPAKIIPKHNEFGLIVDASIQLAKVPKFISQELNWKDNAEIRYTGLAYPALNDLNSKHGLLSSNNPQINPEMCKQVTPSKANAAATAKYSKIMRQMESNTANTQTNIVSTNKENKDKLGKHTKPRNNKSGTTMGVIDKAMRPGGPRH